MSAAIKTRGLGKGISALLGDMEDDVIEAREKGNLVEIDIEKIGANQYQPRKHFDEAALKELSDSIKRSGVMQPIAVRVKDKARGTYELIAGERRLRASKMAGKLTIPAVVKDIADREALELALVENIQRQDLNALEEAEGYRRLMDEFDYTQEQLSGIIGKSRSHIANTLRLMDLPEKVKGYLREGKLSAGHARTLLGNDNAESLADEIISGNLSVRQAEAFVKGDSPKKAGDAPKATSGQTAGYRPAQEKIKNSDIEEIEGIISGNLGLEVKIFDRGNAGDVVIKYNSLQDLDVVLMKLGAA